VKGALLAVFTILGMIIASFLNVIIDRLPQNESIISPPSHCPSCKRRLAAKDLVPFFSYLRLRGRCRYCRAPIPRRVLGMEIAIGALLPLLYWHNNYVLSPAMGILAFYCCLFITILVIDWEKGLILNKLVYPSMIVAVLISVFLHGKIDAGSMDIFIMGNSIMLLPPRIAQAAIGGAIGFGLTLLVVVLSRGGMGWGDVKMAALIGLVVGFPMVFFTLIMAAILGGIVAVVLLMLKRKRRKETIPFGPALSVATMVTLIWGADILGWWLMLF